MTNCIISNLSLYSEKVMEIMVLTKKKPCRVKDFNQVCPNAKNVY